MRESRRWPRAVLAVAALTLLALLSACSRGGDAAEEPAPVVIEQPEDEACHLLDPSDAEQSSNDDDVVDCTEEHTARTFVVDTFPAVFADAAYDDSRLGDHVYRQCDPAFADLVGGDESARLRSLLSWVWFRPQEDAWEAGARWFRCDVVGGNDTAVDYRPLPADLDGLLQDRPDEWMACAAGPRLSDAVRVPCSEDHDWRAATTIRLGREGDDYPGDRLAEVRTRDFCRSSISAWLNYPDSYEFGYTWFGEAEWSVGNRRSICWAKTDGAAPPPS